MSEPKDNLFSRRMALGRIGALALAAYAAPAMTTVSVAHASGSSSSSGSSGSSDASTPSPASEPSEASAPSTASSSSSPSVCSGPTDDDAGCAETQPNL